MSKQKTTEQFEFLPNLKTSLQFIDAYFKHLPYKKKGELEYSLTYYYQDTKQYKSVDEIISEVERCINYQLENKKEINIPAEIVFEQNVIVKRKTIRLFYHCQLKVQDSFRAIFFSWYQNSPKVQFWLNNTLPPNDILSLYENFQTAMADQIKKHE